jgi:uroporphyrinogen-III synthase
LDLHGKRILVTRESDKAAQTAREVAARGAVPVVFPTIEFAPPADAGRLDEAIQRLASYDWVVVASQTGATVIADVAQRLGATLAGPRWAAVGEATARVLREAGVAKVLVPSRRDAEGLLAAVLVAGAGAGRVFVPRAEGGREVVAAGLRAAGATVDDVVAYRTVTHRCDDGAIEALLSGPRLDAALFMSPSAFDGLVEILGTARVEALLEGVATIAIGPTTAAAMRAQGFEPALVPSEPSVKAALDALEGQASSSGG